MSEIKDLSPEEAIKQAWKRWREMNFTWDGLAEPHYVEIDDERGKRQVDWKTNDGAKTTLQKYWLIDPQTDEERTYQDLVAAGEIIECPGKPAYHIVHLPLYYDAEETQPTLKQREPDKTRQKVSEIISERILAIWEPKGEKRVFNFLWLNGAILQDMEFDYKKRDEPLIAVFGDAIFTEPFLISAMGKNAYPGIFRASFLDYCGFYRSRYEDKISLHDTYFFGDVNFTESNIEVLDIYKCRFFSEVNFIKANIDTFFIIESEFDLNIQMSSITSVDTKIEAIEFKGGVNFSWSKFTDTFIAVNCFFYGKSNFIRSQFSDIIFNNSHIFGEFSFFGAEIQRLDFEKVAWPQDPDKYRRAFENAIIGVAHFSGGSPKAFAAFYGALFQRDVRFDPATEQLATTRFQRELKIARNHWRKDAPKIYIFFSHFGFIAKPYQEARDLLLVQIESGCRALKQAMTNSTNKNMEQLFYRFELIARRYQSKTSPAEKILSALYRSCSNYGASYWRPLFRLGIVWVLFSVAYLPFSQKPGVISWPYAEKLVVAGQSSHSDVNAFTSALVHAAQRPTPPVLSSERIIDALSVSASRMFPFGAFEGTSSTFSGDIKEPLPRFIFKLLGTLESFVALTLAFLFGLAVKRRFQIS